MGGFMNRRVSAIAGLLVSIGTAWLFAASVALASDAWVGSGGRIPAWTNSRTVRVSYHARYDLSADGGTHTSDNPAWIGHLDYALGTSSTFSPSWIDGANQTAEFGNPIATIQGTDTVTVSKGNGKKTVYVLYHAQLVNFKAAQPVSPLYQARTTLDTHGPTTKAPEPARGARGTYITLRFRVDDNLSPKARVTIVIRKGTTVVRTLKPVLRATGKLVSRRFLCKLAKGKYTFRVKAKDLAGNAQTKIGANTLIVY